MERKKCRKDKRRKKEEWMTKNNDRKNKEE